MTSVNLRSERIVEVHKLARYISKEEYLRKYTKKEDGYKYEWVDGEIIKSKGMQKYQAYLQDSLFRAFILTQAFVDGGQICVEVETDTSLIKTRKPDLAFYTKAQMAIMRDDISQTPSWVCEVISKTDDMEDVQKKIVEYFAAGVQCVWIILPKNEMVYVYTSVSEVRICQGETICSGAPVMLDFQIEARRLFQKINV
jgi:Uma2 family endonuclease